MSTTTEAVEHVLSEREKRQPYTLADYERIQAEKPEKDYSRLKATIEALNEALVEVARIQTEANILQRRGDRLEAEVTDLRAAAESAANVVEMIARQGRTQGIGCSMITQAPQAVAKSCLNQAGTLIAMRTMGKHERKAVGDWMADKATDDSQLRIDQMLPKLDTGEAWVASPKLLGVYKQTRVSKKTTFDSSSTPKFGAKAVEPKVLASVDLEEIRVSMAETIAAATADDPKTLRKRIAELEREVKAKPAAAPAPKVETKVVEKSVLTEAQLKRFEAVAQKLSIDANAVLTAIKPVADAMYVVKASLGRPPPTLLDRAPARAPLSPRVDALIKDIVDGETKLGRCERALLAALGLRHPRPLSRDQVSILSGYSSTSSSFANALGALRSGGFIEGAADQLRLTAAGETAASDSIGSAPQSATETRQMWHGKLGKAERALFEVLCLTFPEGVSKAELSERSGYSATSNSFANALGRLRTLALAVNGLNGVTASADLFEGER